MSVTTIPLDALCDMAVDVDGFYLECDQFATVRIVGERDSFGIEWRYLCRPCFNGVQREDRALARALAVGTCAVCKRASSTRRLSTQWNDNDYEPAIYACEPCRDAMAQEIADELAYYAERAAARANVNNCDHGRTVFARCWECEAEAGVPMLAI